MKLHKIAWVLLIIGGINWLLIGVIGWGVEDLVGMQIARIIYVLVGVSAVYELFTHKNNCKDCVAKAPSQPQM